MILFDPRVLLKIVCPFSILKDLHFFCACSGTLNTLHVISVFKEYNNIKTTNQPLWMWYCVIFLHISILMLEHALLQHQRVSRTMPQIVDLYSKIYFYFFSVHTALCFSALSQWFCKDNHCMFLSGYTIYLFFSTGFRGLRRCRTG